MMFVCVFGGFWFIFHESKWFCFLLEIHGLVTFCHSSFWTYKRTPVTNFSVYNHQCTSCGWDNVRMFLTTVKKWKHYMILVHLLRVFIDMLLSKYKNLCCRSKDPLSKWRVSYDPKGAKWALPKKPWLLKCSINDLILKAKSLILIHNELELGNQRNVEPCPFIWGLGTIHHDPTDHSRNKAHLGLCYLMAKAVLYFTDNCATHCLALLGHNNWLIGHEINSIDIP